MPRQNTVRRKTTQPELERAVAREIIYALLFDANKPAMIVGGDVETGILLLLDQESRTNH
jgi:hypothetical protein